MEEQNITKILLLGETGVGKSSFGNYIIGKEKFLTQGGGSSVTKTIIGEISERDSYKDIYIIDTPGTQDSKGGDEKYLEELKNSFEDKNAGVRAICLLLNFSQPRFSEYLQKQIHTYYLLFPMENFWEHICIIFTKTYYYIPEDEFNKTKNDLESENGLLNEIINYIKQCNKNINEEKKIDTNLKEIKVPLKLPAYYIDSNLQVEENKNIRTKEEVKKIIKWARTKDYLDIKNISKNKIDVNYLSSERIEDIVINEEQYQEGSEQKLKIYFKKYYYQYKKKTFHNQIITIKDPIPYKIEEIKEEEIKCPQKLISSGKDMKIYLIEHKAVKSKKRVCENGNYKDWENIQNPPDLESCRTISTDKIEEKSYYDKELISKYLEGEKHIEIYQHFKITKILINDIEQTKEERKDNIYKEKRTKEIISETIEKKPYKNNIELSEEIIKEKISIEFDNGDETKIEEKEIKRKQKYYKTIIFEGDEYEERNGYIINKKVKEYRREDEVDVNGNIIIEGVKVKIGERTIDSREERHFIGTEVQSEFDVKEEYEYRNLPIVRENHAARISKSVGMGALIGGSILSFIFPPLGIPLAISGATTSAASQPFENIHETKRQKRKVTKKKEYAINYKKFSDGTREQISKVLVKEEPIYGNWEDC